MSPARETLRRSPGFALALAITLAAAAFNGVMVALMALRLEFLLPGPFAEMGHFTEVHHRIHDLSFGFLFVPALAGTLAQLRSPTRNVAGMLMALIPSAALLLTLAFTLLSGSASVLQPPWLLVMAGALMAAVLHPAGRDFFRSFSVAHVSRVLLALVVFAALPLLVFAFANVDLQGTAADDHARAGHYGFMAAFGFTVMGVGLLASLRLDGWRLTAWVAGLLPIFLGVASAAYPEATSSLSRGWAAAAIAWGVVFVAAAELTKHMSGPGLGTARTIPSRTERG